MTIEERDALILAHVHLAKHAVRKTRGYATSAIGQDDLEQEAISALVACAPKWRPLSGVPFRSYAFVCMFNALRDAIRKETRRSALPLDARVREGPDATTFGDYLIYVDDGLGAVETRLVAEKSLAALPDRERRALLMCLEDQPYARIASELGESVGAVKTIIHRARQRMRRAAA